MEQLRGFCRRYKDFPYVHLRSFALFDYLGSFKAKGSVITAQSNVIESNDFDTNSDYNDRFSIVVFMQLGTDD